MNIQETAQKLVDELQQEIDQGQDNIKMLQGAVQGINLFFNRLAEETKKAEEQSEQHPEAEDSKPKPASSKKKA